MNGQHDSDWDVDTDGFRTISEVKITLVDGTRLTMSPKAFRMQMSIVDSKRKANALRIPLYFKSEMDRVHKKPDDVAFRITLATEYIKQEKIGEDPVHIVSNSLKKKIPKDRTRRIVRPNQPEEEEEKEE